MAKKYPTKKGTTFILAEHIRVEANKKLSLLGVYGGAFVRVFKEPTESEPAAIQLAFLFIFRDGEGEFDTKIRVIDPDGKEIADGDTKRSKKEHKSSMTIGLALAGPVYKKLGTYKAIAQLDDREYDFEFDIDFEESPTQSGVE